ncbi:MAG: hypothetical protein JNK82_34555 [Myxococcaceae bacterium]|nr:hypothetical protein [Myxococcaceae bacterium]
MNDDFAKLLAGGELDRATVDRLKAKSPQEVRALLGRFLPAKDVDKMIERIRALVSAAGDAGAWA